MGYGRINKFGQKNPKLNPDRWYIVNLHNPRKPHIIRITCWSEKYANHLLNQFYRSIHYRTVKGDTAIKLNIPIKKGKFYFKLNQYTLPTSRNFQGWFKGKIKEDLPNVKVFTFINKQVSPKKYYVTFQNKEYQAVADFWLRLGLPLSQVVKNMEPNNWILSPHTKWVICTGGVSITNKFYLRICRKNWVMKNRK